MVLLEYFSFFILLGSILFISDRISHSLAFCFQNIISLKECVVGHERSQPGNAQGRGEAADHGHGPDRRRLDKDAVNQSTAGETDANRKAYGVLS